VLILVRSFSGTGRWLESLLRGQHLLRPADQPGSSVGNLRGLLHAVRKWETATTYLEDLAQEFAQVIVENNDIKTGATVLARAERDDEQRARRDQR